MGKKVLVLFFALFLISLVSATATIGEDYNITVSCNGWDCSNLNITVLNPNSSAFVSDAETVDFGDYASYQLIPQTNGEYTYYLYDGTNYSSGTFSATSSGYTLTTQDSILYLGIFMISVFLFIVFIYGITILPSSNSTNADGEIVSISYLKYLRPVLMLLAYLMVIIILFLISNLGFAYLGDNMVFQIFFTLFRILALMLPLILTLWFIWIFVQIVQDRKMKRLLLRGINPSYNL